MGSNKKNKALGTAKKPLKRPEKRVLVRWNDELDRRLLLSIQSACNTLGLRVPWDKVADLMGPSVSEGAIIQHLAKLRTRTKDFKLPPLRRGGAPTQFAKPSEAADDNGKRRTRSKKQARNDVEDQDDIFDGAYYSESMEEDTEEESEADDSHVGKKAKTASSANHSKREAPRAGPSNIGGNCSEDEYVDDADESVSQGHLKDNDDRSTPSSQGIPRVGLGEEYLNFGDNSSTGENKGPFNLPTMNRHHDLSKMVKLVIPPKRNPEDANQGRNIGEPQKVHWKNESEQIVGEHTNKRGLVAQDQHGTTSGNNIGVQISGGSLANNTSYPYKAQGMSMSNHNGVVGAPNALGPPVLGGMTYPDQIRYGIGTTGNNVFPQFGSTSSMGSGQYRTGFGSDSFGTQGFHGWTPGDSYGGASSGTSYSASVSGTLHAGLTSGASYGGSGSGNSHGAMTAGPSYGSYGISTNNSNDRGWGSTTPGFDGHNSYSSASGPFVDNVIAGMKPSATADSINPCVLDSSNSFFGQGGEFQSGHQSTLFNPSFDGMQIYDATTDAQSGLADNFQPTLGLDHSSFAEEYLNYLTNNNLERQSEIEASNDIFQELP